MRFRAWAVCPGAVLLSLPFLAAPLGARQIPPQAAAASQAFVSRDGRPEYRIGVGDVLKMTVWNGREVLEASVRVSDDGSIFVPFGVNRNLTAQGVSSSQLKRIIQEHLLDYFREAEVQVVIEEFNANRAYLLGEVGVRGSTRGGFHPLRGRKTVLEFIVENGGFAEAANLTAIQVNRASGERLTVNMSDVIFRGDDSQNVVINPGDIVFVPSIEVGGNTYFLFGDLREPGVITSAEPLSVVEAISRAGSFNEHSSRDGVYIARGDLSRPEIIKVDLKKLLEEADFSQNVTLEHHDVVFVSRRKLSKIRDVIGAIAPFLAVIRDSIFIADRR